MLSRRALVGKLAAGAAGAAVAWGAGIGRANAASARPGTNLLAGAGHDDDRRAPAAQVPAPEVREVIDASAPASAPPPWALLRPLAMGSAVAHGWRVAELSGVADGSCVLTLRNARGRTQRVHLCRNDGHPQGLVYTRRFDLVMMNGGQGDLPSEEGLAQAVAQVAHVLAANEGDRRQEPLVTALLPHAERVRQFASSVDRRLR
jgi:hypothetical protein